MRTFRLVKGLELDGDEYIALMTKLIGEARHVQNNPRQGLIPREEVIARHVKDTLAPYVVENGGPLVVEELLYKEGRPNLKITYPGTDPQLCTGLIGSHMDVVPANPETWERDPFALSVEDGKLYGRNGLFGAVGMLTLFFKALAERKLGQALRCGALYCRRRGR